MKKKHIFLATLFASMASINAWPQNVSKNNLTVNQIFTEATAQGGFYPSADISADCLWGLIYIDLSNQTGRGHLALLMQAKALGLKVHVMAVKGTSGYPAGSCLAKQIFLQ